MEEEMVDSAAKEKERKRLILQGENGTQIPKCRKSLTKPLCRKSPLQSPLFGQLYLHIKSLKSLPLSSLIHAFDLVQTLLLQNPLGFQHLPFLHIKINTLTCQHRESIPCLPLCSTRHLFKSLVESPLPLY